MIEKVEQIIAEMPNGCALCNQPVGPHDPKTWKQVRGWVGGPRKDSMRLREDTGYFAHDHCVAKLQAGQAIDQPSMFEEVQDERSAGGTDLPGIFDE